MSPWIWVAIAVVVLAVVVAIGGLIAARDRRLRALIEDLEALGWSGLIGAVWGLMRDPRVPRLVRFLPIPLVLYLAMPVDLIPDFIPVVGQLDDILVVAGALWIVRRFTPPEVLSEHFRVRRV